jgi:hypothetical protein
LTNRGNLLSWLQWIGIAVRKEETSIYPHEEDDAVVNEKRRRERERDRGREPLYMSQRLHLTWGGLKL